MMPPEVAAGPETANNQEQDDRDYKERTSDSAARPTARPRTGDFLIIEINDDAISFHFMFLTCQLTLSGTTSCCAGIGLSVAKFSEDNVRPVGSPPLEFQELFGIMC